MLLFGASGSCVLQLLLATDLDQRLLPDVITLPMIPIALVVAALGWNPLVAGQLPSAIVAAIAVPAVLFALSIPFGAGAIGHRRHQAAGERRAADRLGRAVLGSSPAALLSGVVVVALLATRRVTLEDLHPVRAVPDLRRLLVGAPADG